MLNAECPMPQGPKSRTRIAQAAKRAAINAIYEHLTDAERKKFLAWQKEHVKPGGKTKAYDWPGLKPYLQAASEELAK
jgi:hypothetical protein